MLGRAGTAPELLRNRSGADPGATLAARPSQPAPRSPRSGCSLLTRQS